MVRTRSMKNNDNTNEELEAAHILVKLNKDHYICNKTKTLLAKAQEELCILKKIKHYTLLKEDLVNIITTSNKTIENIDIELAYLYSNLDNL